MRLFFGTLADHETTVILTGTANSDPADERVEKGCCHVAFDTNPSERKPDP
jgi:hypothetical protein